jgi:hypothetical protein
MAWLQSSTSNIIMRLPAFRIPDAYRLGDRLIDSILRWHRLNALQKWENWAGEDADPFWGSEVMLLGIEGQDLNSVASTDLWFIWA